MAAETVVQAVKLSTGRRGRCTVALSGGSTPAGLYALLASPAYDAPVPWGAVDLLWGDERCVPPDHADSNYRLVEESGLLRRHLGGIHRMPGELDPDEGAARYEAELRGLLGARVRGPGEGPTTTGLGPVDGRSDGRPPGTVAPIDLVLLGLGEDGHTASLFPDSPALLEEGRLVTATEEHAGHRRLTLTLPVLTAARRVLFLVSGESKAEAVLRLVDPAAEVPAARVLRGAARVTVLLDRPAAAGLS